MNCRMERSSVDTLNILRAVGQFPRLPDLAIIEGRILGVRILSSGPLTLLMDWDREDVALYIVLPLATDVQ